VPDSRAFAALTLREFNDRLASAEPVPGGGSASAIAGSLGASLVTMVAELSKRPRYMEHASLHGAVEERGRELTARLLQLADDDAASYAAFSAALKLPKDTDGERAARTAAMRIAARKASEVPLDCLQACFEVVLAAELLAGRCNQNASSDLTVATLLAEAAAKGAAANVRVNLPSVGDEAWAVEVEGRVDKLLGDIASTSDNCRAVVASGGLRGPVPAGNAGPTPSGDDPEPRDEEPATSGSSR
jgi:glutamate formiminotransferase/formiminotetrahydrofolate cyclodeaminase